MSLKAKFKATVSGHSIASLPNFLHLFFFQTKSLLQNGSTSNTGSTRQNAKRYDFRHFSAEEFELLVDYMYTSKLIASPDQVSWRIFAAQVFL